MRVAQTQTRRRNDKGGQAELTAKRGTEDALVRGCDGHAARGRRCCRGGWVLGGAAGRPGRCRVVVVSVSVSVIVIVVRRWTVTDLETKELETEAGKADLYVGRERNVAAETDDRRTHDRDDDGNNGLTVSTWRGCRDVARGRVCTRW
jgi:hypothetical protein